jgi:hypothetical protein
VYLRPKLDALSALDLRPLNHAVESVDWRDLAHLSEPPECECGLGGSRALPLTSWPLASTTSLFVTWSCHAARSATGKYRTTPLRGLLQHAPYFHDGSAPDLPAVVNHYDRLFGLNLTADQKADLVEYLKSL